MGWSLSWQPEGRCNSFTREAILASAPPSSGVYGVFNFDCQIFIGESANIREALLGHESKNDFKNLKPTGFTFELCAAELRKLWAAELIERFHPVLQTGAALTEDRSPSQDAIARKSGSSSHDLKTSADDMEFPSHEGDKPADARRRFHFKRPRRTPLVALSAAAAVIIIYFGMPADYSVQKPASGANPSSAQTENGSRPQVVSSNDTAGGFVHQPREVALAEPDLPVSSSTPERD